MPKVTDASVALSKAKSKATFDDDDDMQEGDGPIDFTEFISPSGERIVVKYRGVDPRIPVNSKEWKKARRLADNRASAARSRALARLRSSELENRLMALELENAKLMSENGMLRKMTKQEGVSNDTITSSENSIDCPPSVSSSHQSSYYFNHNLESSSSSGDYSTVRTVDLSGSSEDATEAGESAVENSEMHSTSPQLNRLLSSMSEEGDGAHSRIAPDFCIPTATMPELNEKLSPTLEDNTFPELFSNIDDPLSMKSLYNDLPSWNDIVARKRDRDYMMDDDVGSTYFMGENESVHETPTPSFHVHSSDIAPSPLFTAENRFPLANEFNRENILSDMDSLTLNHEGIVAPFSPSASKRMKTFPDSSASRSITPAHLSPVPEQFSASYGNASRSSEPHLSMTAICSALFACLLTLLDSSARPTLMNNLPADMNDVNSRRESKRGGFDSEYRQNAYGQNRLAVGSTNLAYSTENINGDVDYEYDETLEAAVRNAQGQSDDSDNRKVDVDGDSDTILAASLPTEWNDLSFPRSSSSSSSGSPVPTTSLSNQLKLSPDIAAALTSAANSLLGFQASLPGGASPVSTSGSSTPQFISASALNDPKELSNLLALLEGKLSSVPGFEAAATPLRLLLNSFNMNGDNRSGSNSNQGSGSHSRSSSFSHFGSVPQTILSMAAMATVAGSGSNTDTNNDSKKENEEEVTI